MNIIYGTIRCGFSARNTEFVTKSLIYEIRFDGMSPKPFRRLQARRRIQRGTTPAPNEPTHTKTAAAITDTDRHHISILCTQKSAINQSYAIIASGPKFGTFEKVGTTF
jgi:hypothetical protein